MNIDIRSTVETKIDSIQFTSKGYLQKLGYDVYVTDELDEGESCTVAVHLDSTKEAEFLIKALQKAIELKWWS